MSLREPAAFAALGLNEALLRAVRDLGFTQPTPVQSQVIPLVMQGRDVLGRSQTGTGKTAAFCLPILQRLAEARERRIRLLVVVPTRELAQQVHDHLHALARHTGLRGFIAVGGTDRTPQENDLRIGADWLVATPGRLLEHLQRDYADFGALCFLVLDEADRLMELGFLPDVKKIVEYLPERRQTLLFSATLAAETNELARMILANPARVDVSGGATAEPLTEALWPVSARQKLDLLLALRRDRAIESALVFTRTKARADRLVERLAAAGIVTRALHSDRPMPERQAALAEFRDGTLPILVATDLAARGLDISGITHVINYDVPVAPEDYIHRVGRAGRAGRSGDALTFVAPGEETLIAKIEHLVRRTIPAKRLAGFAYHDEAPQGRNIRGRDRRQSDFSTRETSAEKKPSPFTKSGMARHGFEAPDPAAEQRKKKRKRFRMGKKLPHQR